MESPTAPGAPTNEGRKFWPDTRRIEELEKEVENLKERLNRLEGQMYAS